MSPRLPLALAFVATLAHAIPAGADGTAAAQYRSGTLNVDVSGTEVGMQLRMPMTRADASTAGKQSLTPAEVVAALKSAEKLFAFPEGAGCVPESANAFVVDTQGRPTTGDGNIQAMYRFQCEGATRSPIAALSVRLFQNLPGLEKIKVKVSTEKGETAADLGPGNSDVAF